jgi:uncharacterized membrane protein
LTRQGPGGLLKVAEGLVAMTLEPLIEASVLVQIHVATATAAVVLGAVQFVAPKGLLPHRAIGWTWVGLMVVMVISALLNQDFPQFGPPKLCCGPDGPCLRGYVCAGTHIWTVSCLLALPYAVQHARLHHVQHHRNAMLFLFFGMLITTGIFTFVPKRIMHAIVFETWG